MTVDRQLHHHASPPAGPSASGSPTAALARCLQRIILEAVQAASTTRAIDQTFALPMSTSLAAEPTGLPWLRVAHHTPQRITP